jgi:hypothetical protein
LVAAFSGSYGAFMKDSFDVRTMEQELRSIFQEKAPLGAKLEIVDSVPDWCREHQVKDGNPFREGVAFPASGLVVLSATVSEDVARSSGSLFTIGPAAHDALARDLPNYARYLLLHEIAHLHGMLDEPTADRWALTQLNALLAGAGEPPIEG